GPEALRESETAPAVCASDRIHMKAHVADCSQQRKNDEGREQHASCAAHERSWGLEAEDADLNKTDVKRQQTAVLLGEDREQSEHRAKEKTREPASAVDVQLATARNEAHQRQRGEQHRKLVHPLDDVQDRRDIQRMEQPYRSRCDSSPLEFSRGQAR